jgi:hypothetical protein
LNTTKIIRSPNLTDAIIDDSYSQVHLASSTNTIHADSLIKTAPLMNFSALLSELNAYVNGVMPDLATVEISAQLQGSFQCKPTLLTDQAPSLWIRRFLL